MDFLNSSVWTPRAKSLEAVAVVARDAGARDLARRLLDRSDTELLALRGAASLAGAAPLLAVSGSFEQLPWASEAIFLGRDGAPSLLFPTHLAPLHPPELLERALRRRFATQSAPLAVLPMWNLVLPLGEALPLRRELVEKWLNGASQVSVIKAGES